MSRLADTAARGAFAFLAVLMIASNVAAQEPVKPVAALAPLGLGRTALPDEIKAWDTDVRFDGTGLPPGKGTVKQGDQLYQERCASCHGEFGEGTGRWPVLAGGHGTLKADRPDKTIGSFWPYLSTVFDYMARAMPYGNARSLTPDEIYALTAYLLQMNDVVKDESFELSDKNFMSITMPNAGGFRDDDREAFEKEFWSRKPCMKNCKPPQKVIGRAISIDVTPDSKSGPKVD